MEGVVALNLGGVSQTFLHQPGKGGQALNSPALSLARSCAGGQLVEEGLINPPERAIR